MTLFLDNADHHRNAANDELVLALRQRARQIEARTDLPGRQDSAQQDEVPSGEPVPVSPTDGAELAAWMRRAHACGFRFWQPHPDAAWWGERHTAQWCDVVFRHPCGPSNAARTPNDPGEGLVAQRVSGDALRVLRTVCHDWPI